MLWIQRNTGPFASSMTTYSYVQIIKSSYVKRLQRFLLDIEPSLNKFAAYKIKEGFISYLVCQIDLHIGPQFKEMLFLEWNPIKFKFSALMIYSVQNDMFILPLKSTDQNFLTSAKLCKSSPSSRVLPILRMLVVWLGALTFPPKDLSLGAGLPSEHSQSDT